MESAVRIGRVALVTLLVLAAAWLFWPTALGGRTTYVATHGASMQPRFHTGDLAILTPADRYSTGDVVAYRSATLKTTVMHRIVAQNGDSFLMQGDNNSWTDPDRPTPDEVLGKLWLRVPHGGQAIAALRSPWVLAALAMAGATLTAALSSRGRRRAGRRRPPRRAASLPLPARARARQATLVLSALTLVAAVGEAALLLLPTAQSGSHTVQVVQQGRFSYTGTAQPGTTYPTGSLRTGDPIYPRLVRGLAVSFTDAVSGADEARGTVRLDVSVSTSDGWRATIGHGAEAVLAEGAATASVPLDPAAAAQVLARHDAEIGATAATGGTLTVSPVVTVTGTAGGRPFSVGSPRPISFALDAATLRLTTTGQDALAPVLSTAVETSTVTARTLSFHGLSVALPQARFGLALLLFALLIGSAVAAWLGRSRPGDAADEFAVRHGSRLLEVTDFAPGATVIDVAEPEALYRVAERLDGLVLHHAGDDADTFAVQDGDTTYRCVVPRTAARPAAVQAEPMTTLPPVPAPGLRNRFA
jgi:signal peptidase I